MLGTKNNASAVLGGGIRDGLHSAFGVSCIGRSWGWQSGKQTASIPRSAIAHFIFTYTCLLCTYRANSVAGPGSVRGADKVGSKWALSLRLTVLGGGIRERVPFRVRSRFTGISGGPCTQEAPGGNLSTGFPKKYPKNSVQFRTANESAVSAAQKNHHSGRGGGPFRNSTCWVETEFTVCS